MTSYEVGVDLGQVNDYSTIVVVEVPDGAGEPVYNIRLLERIALRTTYPKVVDRVCAVIGELKKLHVNAIQPVIKLSVDGTGVGRGVTDLLRLRPELRDVDLLVVTITAGQAVTIDHGQREARVAKSALVAAVQVSLQQNRLKISGQLEMADVLTAEMRAFRVRHRIETMSDSFGSWRESDHDDLLLGMALAVWRAEEARRGARLYKTFSFPYVDFAHNPKVGGPLTDETGNEIGRWKIG